MNNIIHISGASGSGKTTLGNKLKEHFGKKIIVKDLDDLRDEHIKKTYDTSKGWSIDEIKYQKCIDDFIDKQKKPIIFVGLNDNPLGTKNIYYNVHSQYNFYIDIDDKIIVKQKCIRFFNDDLPSHFDNEVINDIMNNNEFFIKQITKLIKNECNLKKTIKMNNKWRKDYEKQGYTFMSRENIFKHVIIHLRPASFY
jgi:adenylate kinase family enzyme